MRFIIYTLTLIINVKYRSYRVILAGMLNALNQLNKVRNFFSNHVICLL